MKSFTLLLIALLLGLVLASTAQSLAQQPVYGKPLGSITIYRELAYNVTIILTYPHQPSNSTSTTSTNSTNTSKAEQFVTQSYFLNYILLNATGANVFIKVSTDLPKALSFVNNGTYNVNVIESPLTPEYPFVPPQFLAPINWTNFSALAQSTTYAGFLISGQKATVNLVNPTFSNSTYYASILVSNAWNFSLNDVRINLEGYLESASFSFSTTLNGTVVNVKGTISLMRAEGAQEILEPGQSDLMPPASAPILYAVKTFNPLSQSLRVSGFLQLVVPYVINNGSYVMVYYPLQPSSFGYVVSPQLALQYPTYVFETVVNVSTSPSYIIPNAGAKEIKWNNATMKLVGAENVTVSGNTYFTYVYNGIINGTQNVTIYVTRNGLLVKEYVFDLTKDLPALELDYLGPYFVSPTQTNEEVVYSGGPYTTLPYNVVDPKFFYVLTVAISVVIVIAAVIFRLR